MFGNGAGPGHHRSGCGWFRRAAHGLFSGSRPVLYGELHIESEVGPADDNLRRRQDCLEEQLAVVQGEIERRRKVEPVD